MAYNTKKSNNNQEIVNQSINLNQTPRRRPKMQTIEDITNPDIDIDIVHNPLVPEKSNKSPLPLNPTLMGNPDADSVELTQNKHILDDKYNNV